MRLDTSRDGFHAFPITRMWKEVVGNVDAVFNYGDKMYLIKVDFPSFSDMKPLKLCTNRLSSDTTLQGKQVYIYKSGAHYTLVEGYPKTLAEELGVEGPVDAAFVCPGQHTVHIIQGKSTLGDNNDKEQAYQLKKYIDSLVHKWITNIFNHLFRQEKEFLMFH